MLRSDILDTAKAHVTTNRQNVHGDAEDNFNTVARFWGSYLDRPMTAVDVAAMMSLWKTARIKANPAHEDNWIDGAGYLALGGEIAHQPKPTEPAPPPKPVDPPPPPKPMLGSSLTPVQAFLMVLGSTSRADRDKLLCVTVQQAFADMLCAGPTTANLVTQGAQGAAFYDGIPLRGTPDPDAEMWVLSFADDEAPSRPAENYDPTGGSGVGD